MGEVQELGKVGKELARGDRGVRRGGKKKWMRGVKRERQRVREERKTRVGVEG